MLLDEDRTNGSVHFFKVFTDRLLGVYDNVLTNLDSI